MWHNGEKAMSGIRVSTNWRFFNFPTRINSILAATGKTTIGEIADMFVDNNGRYQNPIPKPRNFGQGSARIIALKLQELGFVTDPSSIPEEDTQNKKRRLRSEDLTQAVWNKPASEIDWTSWHIAFFCHLIPAKSWKILTLGDIAHEVLRINGVGKISIYMNRINSYAGKKKQPEKAGLIKEKIKEVFGL